MSITSTLGLTSPADLGMDAYATTDDQCTNWNACGNAATHMELGVPVCGSCNVYNEGGGRVSVSRH